MTKRSVQRNNQFLDKNTKPKKISFVNEAISFISGEMLFIVQYPINLTSFKVNKSAVQSNYRWTNGRSEL